MPKLNYIRVHQSDNVGIVTDVDGAIPQGQKVALGVIEKGQPVIRYSHPIGIVSRDFKPGDWVRGSSFNCPRHRPSSRWNWPRARRSIP